ncbi:alpha/beta fold hydrolase [Halalkalibacter urbisdiaboli]|uniref:alpha/beta fold hydrolase n=1 Tax=Halalkalibacter urbisdiaboli TaxID=1960589 RepID=UPI000B44177A|nr:alpha/beta hydrolase [Halalkalibacter urbisdiaboli]
MPYVRGNGPAIYYEVEGVGTPIVFIHPPGMGHVTFHLQRRLAETYQTIFLDLRGNGRSGRTKESVTVEDMAYDVFRVVDKLKLEKAIICGYSNGGSIAQEFALRYPERTSGVALCGGFPEVSTFLLEKEFELGIWGAKNRLMSLFGQVLARSHYKETQNVNILNEYVKKTNPQMLQTMYENGLEYTCTERLPQLDVPLLLIYGSRDFYIHFYQYQYAKRVKNLEIVHVSKSTHQVPTKFPDEFNMILKSWIERKVKNKQHVNV